MPCPPEGASPHPHRIYRQGRLRFSIQLLSALLGGRRIYFLWREGGHECQLHLRPLPDG
jgi:hypothetical protein